MEIEFDPDKEAINLEKHQISLGRAADIEVLAVDRVERKGEVRLQAFGVIDQRLYSLTFTFRWNAVRPISLRRARLQEMMNVSEKNWRLYS